MSVRKQAAQALADERERQHTQRQEIKARQLREEAEKDAAAREKIKRSPLLAWFGHDWVVVDRDHKGWDGRVGRQPGPGRPPMTTSARPAFCPADTPTTPDPADVGHRYFHAQGGSKVCRRCLAVIGYQRTTDHDRWHADLDTVLAALAATTEPTGARGGEPTSEGATPA